MIPLIGRFRLWRFTPSSEVINLGVLAVSQTAQQKLIDINFAYTNDYLSHPDAIPLDPINAPLKPGVIQYPTRGSELPGFIDDCMPDKWGERVLAIRHSARHLDKITLLNVMSGIPLGDIQITPLDAPAPVLRQGITLERAGQLHNELWDGNFKHPSISNNDLDLLVLVGSGSGGARPKILVSHQGKQWLAKFDKNNDKFSIAGAEWASLKLAQAAGLQVPEVQIHTIGARRCLLVERFDVSSQGGRHHLLTLNALVKDRHSQDDAVNSRYEDLASIIKTYSITPKNDLKQLLGQILINSVVHNTDDHARNFSLIHRGSGWQLSPAYDIVPQQGSGAYSALSFMGKPFLPSLEQAAEAAKALGLSEGEGDEIKINIRKALKNWPTLLKQGGVADQAFLQNLGKL